MTITKEEAIKKYGEDNVRSFYNGYWAYKDKFRFWNPFRTRFWNLYRNDIELTKGIKARMIEFHSDGVWAYQDKQGFLHLGKNDTELTKNTKAHCVCSLNNGNWKWKDEDGKCHEVKTK